MNNYDLDRGSIWEVYYLTKSEIQIDTQTEQLLIDKQSRELSATFDPPSELSPAEYSQLFMTHFMKSREKSREIINKGKEKLVRYKIFVQVGNQECLNDMTNIEAQPDFKEWENLPGIQFFKQLSQGYLNG